MMHRLVSEVSILSALAWLSTYMPAEEDEEKNSFLHLAQKHQQDEQAKWRNDVTSSQRPNRACLSALRAQPRSYSDWATKISITKTLNLIYFSTSSFILFSYCCFRSIDKKITFFPLICYFFAGGVWADVFWEMSFYSFSNLAEWTQWDDESDAMRCDQLQNVSAYHHRPRKWWIFTLAWNSFHAWRWLSSQCMHFSSLHSLALDGQYVIAFMHWLIKFIFVSFVNEKIMLRHNSRSTQRRRAHRQSP